MSEKPSREAVPEFISVLVTINTIKSLIFYYEVFVKYATHTDHLHLIT